MALTDLDAYPLPRAVLVKLLGKIYNECLVEAKAEKKRKPIAPGDRDTGDPLYTSTTDLYRLHYMILCAIGNHPQLKACFTGESSQDDPKVSLRWDNDVMNPHFSSATSACLQSPF
jgi:hypothetical protein